MLGSLLLTMTGFGLSSYAEDKHKHDEKHKHSESEDSHDGHDHGKKKKKKSSHDSHDHGKKKNHKKDDGHDHDDETNHDDEDDHDHSSLEDEHNHGDSKEESHAHNEEGEGGHAHDGDEHEDAHAHNEETEEDGHGHGGHGGHDEHGGSKFGPDKAIVEVKNEGDFFKLSKEAEKTLNVQTAPLENFKEGSNFFIPSKSVVYYQDKIGVFVMNDGWIQLIPVKVDTKDNDKTSITGRRLDPSMNLIISGVPLVRVAHLEASGQGGQGHAH